MYRVPILLLPSILFTLILNAQIHVGAQVYIEPGQKSQSIERWFTLLEEYGMTVCRIRMDETHMKTSDGYDFSLYDKAFDEAQKHGIQVFATIFPAEENAKGVGGFKFPNTDNHQQQIANFIKELVSHFKDHPALKAWVLQNEPGVGRIPNSTFSQEKFEEWKTDFKYLPVYNDFIRKHQIETDFLFDYTTWYLEWIAKEIRKYDLNTEFHVNNHMIFELLPEYDFLSWNSFLDHLGASMHPSWHFGYFERAQFPLAISANCNLIRNGAGELPFWVTELQAGNNNFSGFNPIMPSSIEIQQWMLTSIFSGTKGIIFWTLNPRSVGFEAGEWALIDYQNNPTKRLEAAGDVNGFLERYPDVANARPLTSDIHVLYSRPSMAFQKNSEISSDYVNQVFDARKKGGHIKSVLGYYQAILSQGITPQIASLEEFDWEKGKGIVILPNMVIIPREFYARMEEFVKRGGVLLMTGQSGHLDEYQFNVLQEDWPLTNLFGAKMVEFEMVGDQFNLNNKEYLLAGHYLRGKVETTTAEVLFGSENAEVFGVQNSFGKGKSVWIPSMLGLGSWKFNSDLGKLVSYFHEGSNQFTATKNLLIQQLESTSYTYSLIINTSGHKQLVVDQFTDSELIFGEGYLVEDNWIAKEGFLIYRRRK